MAGEKLPIDIDPNVGQIFFPNETAADAVDRIVMGNPIKHGTSLQERERRAIEAAKRREAPIDEAEQMYIERCRELGLDPDATMIGNKPRFTMSEAGDVKDHETGDIYAAQAGVIGEDQTVGQDDEQPHAAQCAKEAHVWSADPAPDESCKVCGLTFKEWAES